MENNSQTYELNKVELAGYLIYKYNQKYHRRISPVKLQKTLYLLFAMWGGNIRNIDFNEVELESNLSKYLFNANFEAWKCGPVDREIYELSKENQIVEQQSLTSESDTVLSFIEDICSQTFEISDFALIDLVKQDFAWQNKYYNRDTYMDNEEIIEEYSLTKRLA